PGILEIKNVDFIQYRDKWEDDEAPPHIEFQAQHQMEVLQHDWSLIAALVAGNDIKYVYREKDEEMCLGICKKIEQFWKDVDADKQPKPDYERDADIISALYATADGEPYDGRGDAKILQLCEKYQTGSDKEKEGKKMKDAAKAEIIDLVKTAPRVLADDGFSITLTQVHGKPDSVITKEMVGDTIKGRSGYRLFRLTKKKES
ncbi:MAG: hypothetical protein ACPGO7_02770, partial [Alphaproteobacteria bacterium]